MEETPTKKLLWILALTVLLSCLCAAALAEAPEEHTPSHRTEERAHGAPVIQKTDSQETHSVVTAYDLYCLDCGRVIEENVRTESAEQAHNWRVARVEPGCESDGEEIKICSACGMEIRQTLPQTGHQYAGAAMLMRRDNGPVSVDGKLIGMVIKAPTCTLSGSGTLVCLHCQNAAQSVTIPPLGHEWGEWTDVPVDPKLVCVTDVKVSRKCLACGEVETSVVSAAPGHQWQEVARIEPTCIEPGTSVLQCTVCGSGTQKPIPVISHVYADASQLVNQNAGNVMGTGEYAGKIIGRVTVPSTCMATGSGTLLCLLCQNNARTVTIPKGEHQWGAFVEQEVPPDMICVTPVIATRVCENCGEEDTQTISAAPGHQWTPVSFQEPTCTEPGRAVRECAVCHARETLETPAMGHSYMWLDVNTPSPSGSGIREYVCTTCGDVAQRQTIAYAQMYYNNTITSFGPMTRDLIGGAVWYRVTPLDISQDGVFTYPLIASNLYTVGTATVVIDQGVQTISYHLNSSRITVHTESLVLYPNAEALRTGENAVPVAFDAPITLNDYFGDDTSVIMSIVLRADYDAAGSGIQDFIPDQALIKKMIELID